MIGLSAPSADISGSMIFDEDQAKTKLNPAPTRASRKKCLDASVNIEHSGVVDGDRTFSIVVRNASRAAYEFVEYLQKNYTTAICSCREGLFTGIIKDIKMASGILTVTYWVSERLDG